MRWVSATAVKTQPNTKAVRLAFVFVYALTPFPDWIDSTRR